MRIAIIGSTRDTSGRDIGDPSGWRQFCQRLGTFLAGTPHKILVASDMEGSADRWVVNGVLAARAPVRCTLHVYQRLGKKPSFVAEANVRRGLIQRHLLSEHLLVPAHLAMLRHTDIAIIIGGGRSAYPAGLSAGLMGVRLFPIASFGGAGEMLWKEFSDAAAGSMIRRPTQQTWNYLTGTNDELIAAIKEEFRGIPRLLLVHGRSGDRHVVSRLLTEADFRVPVMLRDVKGAGDLLAERFEREAIQADAAVVLFTPDDEVTALLDGSGELTDRAEVRRLARQNVTLEYGWFWGKRGRDRILLMLKGGLDLPSDLGGLVYESYQDSPTECRDALVRFAEDIRNR